MTGLVYELANGRSATDCPLCGQACRVDRRGDHYRFHCYGGCPDSKLATAIDPAVMLELAGAAKNDASAAGRRAPSMNGYPREAQLRQLDVARMVCEDPPPIPWVVEGLVVEGMLTIAHGRQGEGKSLLAESLAAGVALAEEVASYACRLGRAVIVDAENGPYEIHRRVRTLGLPGENVDMYEANAFDLRRNLDALEEVLNQHRPDLLILDSFRSLWCGDENDSREVPAALDPLRNLIRRYGAGTLLVHHSGKSNLAYRGSSAIGACAELGFRLGREDGDPERDRRYLSCWKCRPAPEPERRWLRLSAERGMVLVDAAAPYESGAEQPGRPPSVANELAPQVLRASVRNARAGPRSRSRWGGKSRTARSAGCSIRWPRRNDGATGRRATRASLARHRLARGPGRGAAQLRAR